jgi:hypothetical protein
MELDDDPIFSEWSSQTKALQSLAPYEITYEDEAEYAPRAVSPERRARLQRYVKATVVGCVGLCAVAIVRVGVSHVIAAREEALAPSPPATMTVAVTVMADDEPAIPVAASGSVPQPPALIPAAPLAPIAPAASIAAPARTTAPSPVAAAAPIAPAPVARAATPFAPARSPLQEREAARAALEHGKAKDAVASAARATAGDPGDAEGWLILGSAQQELGHAAAARDAFLSCVKSAKRGPVGECAAMLH